MKQIDQNLKHHLSRLPFDLWKAAFGILIGLCVIAIVTTTSHYGISSDEHLTVAYGEAIYKWYASGFQDQTVFQSRNTWLYGGFLNLVVHIIHKIVGGDIYEVGHFCNALVGLLGLIAAYRIGSVFGGVRAGFLSALFLLLIPRYYGHIFNNPRDIPFAVFYLWSIYFLLQIMLKGQTWKYVIWAGLATGLTLGIRAGGVIIWVYAAFFLCLQWWLCKPSDKTIKRPIMQIITLVSISYIVMGFFWPWAQVNPISALSDALSVFSSFPDTHVTFFEGRYLGNDEIPRYYTLKWLLLTLPEFALFGLGVGMVFTVKQYYNITLQWCLLLASALFPLAYATLANTPLYDGLRHMLFTVPPLAIISALSIHKLLCNIGKKQQIICVIGLSLSLGFTSREMVLLHPYQYVYFNHIVAGGITQAEQAYETDYWEHSYKAGVQWIKSQNHAHQSVSSFYDMVGVLLDAERSTFVRPNEQADYYLGTTRYDRHRVIPGEIVHTIQVRSVPLLFIIRPDSTYQNNPFFFESPFRHIYLAEQQIEAGHLSKAITSYERALSLIPKRHPNPNRIGHLYIKIGNLSNELGDYETALRYYKNALQHHPQNPEIQAIVHNNIGILLSSDQEYSEAIIWHKKALEFQPDYVSAYEEIGDAYANMAQIDSAIAFYDRALSISPKNAELLHKLGKFCYLQNRPKHAIRIYRNLIEQDPQDASIHYYLGISLATDGDTAAAIKSLQQALVYHPNDFQTLSVLGKLYMTQKAFGEAEKVLLKAIKLNEKDADIYNNLGMVYVQLDRYNNAMVSFNRALQLNPNHSDAQKNLEILSEALK